MTRGRGRRWCWLVIALAAVAPGCGRQDKERLARVAHKVAEKTGEMTGGVSTKLATGWQSFRANLDDVGLDARVSSRMRWDRTLADTPIEVTANGPVVELHGTVQDLTQRRRAVELAQTTVGVERVVDLLEMPESSP